MSKIVFLDGGTGTVLQGRGLPPGVAPENWNIERPEEIRAVHSAYAAAGSDIVCTCTFGANREKYHGDHPLAEVIAAAMANARASGARVALDIGPTGRLLSPAGDFAFDAAYSAFAEQVRLGAMAKPDLVLIETMGDTRELKAAVLAARENCDLPVYATVALGEDGKLLTGGDVESVAALLNGLRVDALGFNCGLGPDRMLPYVKRLAQATNLPIIVKPNAGMPKVVDGKTIFPVGPEEFARQVEELVKAGAAIVGGCCGTTPEHLAAVHARLGSLTPDVRPTRVLPTTVSSGTHTVTIPLDDTVIIGERINPTGKKKLKAALLEGDLAYVLREAVAQAEAGAKILDVNTGVPGIDEPATLAATVEAVQGVVDLPIEIDTSDPIALERALRIVNGKPLVNSVNGKQESLDAVLPLVAKYGGVVVALTLDEDGIPPTADGRLKIARRILDEGAKYGLAKDDFVIDCLCLSIAATQGESANADAFPGRVILESLKRVKSELGCRTCLGVSNISFGLPARAQLNGAFFTLAMEAGLSAAIVNPLSDDMMRAYRAWRALTGRDAQCGEWIAAAALVAAEAPVSSTAIVEDSAMALESAVRRGLKADAAQAARQMLQDGRSPLDVINLSVVPALEKVGKGFEAGQLFLPQLLMAADAASAAFGEVRAKLAATGADAGEGKGPIVFATVKGDIHDIGKNICCSLLENYGFKVIDLGRDVAPETVLEAARRNQAPIVGLSALMTTTVGFMEETVKLIHAELPNCRVVVGGAVLTADYAAKIGADSYSHDAMEMVRICEKLLER